MSGSNEKNCDGDEEENSTDKTGGGGESNKRKRTDSSRETSNPSWLTASSPPRFISFEELMSAVEGLDKMALAHEIAVNSDFRLPGRTENADDAKTAKQNDVKTTPIKNAADLHKTVERMMHKAFWDLLKSKLDERPPNYEHALNLLKEIKEILVSLLLPHHAKLRSNIEEHLDLDLIEQQCKNECFDFLPVAGYILEVMSKLCAPVRDEAIGKLRQSTDIVELFKGIFEQLDAMKLDMANFTIASMRPAIQQHSVEYERKKFDEFLKINPSGLIHTTEWLKQAWHSCHNERHVTKCQAVGSSSSPTGSSSSSHVIDNDKILAEAYWSLLELNDYDKLPETLMVDQTRLIVMRDQYLRLIIVSSCIIVTVNFGGKDLSTSNVFKNTLKETLFVLFDGCDSNNLAERLLNISERVVSDIEKYLKEITNPAQVYSPLEQNKKESLKKQIVDLADPNNMVRKVIRDRVKTFVTTVVATRSASPVKFPPGLSTVEKELSGLTGSFARLVWHNSAVFNEHYRKILAECKRLDGTTATSSSVAHAETGTERCCGTTENSDSESAGPQK